MYDDKSVSAFRVLNLKKKNNHGWEALKTEV